MAHYTAVEWLTEILIDNKYLSKDAEHLFAEAKKIEKEQIINAYSRAYRIGSDITKERADLRGNEYYNETFKSEI